MTKETLAGIMGVEDPTVPLMGGFAPALTTLLYRVCNNDPERFEEASRLAALFYEAGKKDSKTIAPLSKGIGVFISLGQGAEFFITYDFQMGIQLTHRGEITQRIMFGLATEKAIDNILHHIGSLKIHAHKD